MTDVQLKEIYPVPENFRATAHINSHDAYKQMYRESIDHPENFWRNIAEEYVTWFKKWDKVADCNYGQNADDLYIRWFTNAKLNVSYNCLDWHLNTRGDQTATIWEGNEPGEDKKSTYRELHAEVCKFANVLKNNGVKKGDGTFRGAKAIPQKANAVWTTNEDTQAIKKASIR